VSDERLRELERRFREVGTTEAEADWLRERLRAGELVPARLELAGLLGHEAARLVCPPSGPLGLRHFRDLLRAAGAEAGLRYLVVVAGAGVEGFGGGVALRTLLERVERWIAGEGRGAELLEAAEAAAGPASFSIPVRSLVGAARAAARDEGAALDGVVAREALSACVLHQVLPPGLENADHDRLRERLRVDVLPWLVGAGDPVRERVQVDGRIEIRPEDL